MIGGVINILLADTNVTTLVGNRIYPLRGPQKPATKWPFITVTSGGRTDTSETKDGSSGLDYISCVVTTFVKPSDGMYAQAEAIASAVRKGLDRKSGTFGGEVFQSIKFEDEVPEVDDVAGIDNVYTVESIFIVSENIQVIT